MADGGSVIFHFEGDDKDLQKAISEVKVDLNSLATKVTGNVGKGFTKLGATIMAAMAGITASLGTAVKRFDTLNNYPKILSSLGINSDDAKESINELSKAIDGLPTSLNDAASGVQRFVAKNGDIKKATQYFIALNDAVVAGNAPAEAQASAIEQITQAYSKGKPDAMEWRSLMVAAPGQMNQVAKAMGYANAALLGQAMTGKDATVSMEDFMDTLVKLDTTGSDSVLSFAAQAKNATDSIQTALTNFKNRFQKGFASILSGIDEAVKNSSNFTSIASIINAASTTMKTALDKIGASVKTNKAVQTLIQGITTALEKLNSVVNKLTPEQLDKFVTAIVKLGEAGPVLLVLGKGFEKLSSMITAYNNVAGLFKSISGGMKKELLGFGGVFDILKTSAQSTGKVLTKTFQGIGSSINLTGMFSKLGKMFQVGFANLYFTVLPFNNKIRGLFSTIGSGASKLLAPVTQVFGAIASKISPITNIVGKIGETFTTSLGGILSTVVTFGQKFLPVFVQAFSFTGVIGAVFAGFGLLRSNFVSQLNTILNLVTTQGPTIITTFANSITNQLPYLISSGNMMVQLIINAITANIPAILQAGANIIASLVAGIGNALPTLIPTTVNMIATIVNNLIANLPQIIDAGVQLLEGLIKGIINTIPVLAKQIPTIIETIGNVINKELPKIIEAGIEILIALINGIVNALPQLINMLPTIINTIITVLINNLPKIIDAGIRILIALINGLTIAIPQLIRMLPQIISTIVRVLAQNMPAILRAGVQIITSLIAGIISLLGSVGNAGWQIVRAIGNVLKQIPRQALQWGKDIIQGFVNGIKSMIGAVGNAAKSVGNKVKSFLHFSRPDEGPLRDYEKWMPDMIKGMTKSLNQASPMLFNTASKVADRLNNAISGTYTANPTYEADYGSINKQQTIIVKVENNVETDPLGQVVNNIKTFSNGSKNDYNYGFGGA